MYHILYKNKANVPVCDLIQNEDAMNDYVHKLVNMGINPDDITVIHNDNHEMSFTVQNKHERK